MFPRIKEFKLNDDYTINIVFTNDELGIFDLKPFLDKGSFKSLNDLMTFKSAKLNDGVLTWNQRLDISPDTVYMLCTKN
ncbi:MAG: hypothetical protein HW421_2661 [Ignavibacteria bacterium]|nr:hypothetical protein [Ignavibacteria bacterium]